MGGRGASYGTGRFGKSGMSAKKSESVYDYASQAKTKVDGIGNKDVREYLENRTASDFINAPATVNVKGVEFQYLTKTEVLRGTKKEHILSYQSSEQNSQGEWPILDIYVTEHKTRNSTYYTFRYGGTGSRINK